MSELRSFHELVGLTSSCKLLDDALADAPPDKNEAKKIVEIAMNFHTGELENFFMERVAPYIADDATMP